MKASVSRRGGGRKKRIQRNSAWPKGPVAGVYLFSNAQGLGSLETFEGVRTKGGVVRARSLEIYEEREPSGKHGKGKKMWGACRTGSGLGPGRGGVLEF